MPAVPGPRTGDPGLEPAPGQKGLPGRVELAWTMAGGVLAGGVLMSTATLTGKMNPSVAFYGTSLFFILGAVLGLVHGVALGLLGRPPGSTWSQTAAALGLGALALLPGVVLAWAAATFISMTSLSLSLERPLLLVGVTVGWAVGLSICAWAALDGYRALRNALARWPEARRGGPLVPGIFLVVLFLCLWADPQIWQIRITGWSAAVLAAALTVWIGLPAVVLGMHLLKRLDREALLDGRDLA